MGTVPRRPKRERKKEKKRPRLEVNKRLSLIIFYHFADSVGFLFLNFMTGALVLQTALYFS